jgi:pyruvate ferredoxin oxidoreductase gamma subunit
MFQVRIHGRGGQGVVTAAEILSVAAFDEGRHAQAFPSFGSERMGAPVVSFCRMDDHLIRTREPVVEPDALIVQDVTLIHQVDLFAGLSPDGYVLVNTSRSFEALGLGTLSSRFRSDRLLSCPATELALEHLGRPLPNAALLGGFAALTGQVTLEAVRMAVCLRYPGAVGDQNSAAAAAAHRLVTLARETLEHAASD